MPVKKINENDIIAALRYNNPWWETGAIQPQIDKLPQREYFKLYHPFVEQTEIRRAVVLMGPRRVGKTVMIYQSVSALIKKGIPQKKICYINIDNPLFTNIFLDRLMWLVIKASGGDSPDGYYIFFDEIQYLLNWEQHLKVLVDTYFETKFVASGSAAAALKRKSIESGAGRFRDFVLPALSFYEFVKFKERDELFNKENEHIYVDERNELLEEYINFGGYPELIFPPSAKKAFREYIREDIIDKVLLKDIPGLYNIADSQDLNNFFTMLAYNVGEIISIDELSSKSGIAKNTIKKYLEFLEAAFLIKIIYRVDDNAKKLTRQNFFKVYLINSALRTALFGVTNKDDSDQFGHLLESAYFSQLSKEYNKRTIYFSYFKGGEVDVVYLDKLLKITSVLELKWSDRYYHKPNQLKSLITFCRKNNIRKAQCTTKSINGTQRISDYDIDINYRQAALVIYEESKKNIDS